MEVSAAGVEVEVAENSENSEGADAPWYVRTMKGGESTRNNSEYSEGTQRVLSQWEGTDNQADARAVRPYS